VAKVGCATGSPHELRGRLPLAASGGLQRRRSSNAAYQVAALVSNVSPPVIRSSALRGAAHPYAGSPASLAVGVAIARRGGEFYYARARRFVACVYAPGCCGRVAFVSSFAPPRLTPIFEAS